MPVICRDEIKEGYVNTFGVKHDELPPDTNRLVTDFFFDLVNRYLAGNISVVIEAAFQHNVWEPRIPLGQLLAAGLKPPATPFALAYLIALLGWYRIAAARAHTARSS